VPFRLDHFAVGEDGDLADIDGGLSSVGLPEVFPAKWYRDPGFQPVELLLARRAEQGVAALFLAERADRALAVDTVPDGGP